MPRSRPDCRRKMKRGEKPKPKLVNAQNSKPGFALKSKRRFAPKKPSAERPNKLSTVAPSTKKSWPKKLQRPNNSANTFSNSNRIVSARRPAATRPNVSVPGAVAMGPALPSSKSNALKKSLQLNQRRLPKLPRSPNGSTLG